MSLAGHVALTQGQLAEWDNSARAWLQHADRVRSRQQDQVKIILSSIEGLAVNAKTTTYRSVIDAWMTALNGMEKLLKGSPQGVSNGGLLLALASWHLYPDIIVCVHVPSTTIVFLTDTLNRRLAIDASFKKILHSLEGLH